MPWQPKRTPLYHAQGSGGTACGKRYGWRLYVVRRRGEEVTCKKCVAAMKRENLKNQLVVQCNNA